MKTNGPIEFVSLDGEDKIISNIDEEINGDSKNPVANSAVFDALNEKADNIIATADVAGIVKLGSDAVQTVIANDVTATLERTYAVQLNEDGQMVVNVPWINTDIDVDNVLSKTSINPVQNRVITNKFDEKLSKSGDTMTGSLTVPKILGAGENEGKGIIPVRYITREELGTATSDVEGYIQAWIKKVCDLYPNTDGCMFIGSGNPAAAITLQAYIYKMSERNSDGMPRYGYGMCLEYGYTNNIQQFSIVEYAYNPKKPFMTREGRWLDGDVKNATHSGVYYCSADSTGLPSGANRFGQLFVSHEHDTIAQIYIAHENKQMWARGGKYSGGEVWTDWYRLANYDEVYSPNNPPPFATPTTEGTVHGFTTSSR